MNIGSADLSHYFPLRDQFCRVRIEVAKSNMAHFYLLFSGTTNDPYQNRQEQNENEEISEFSFHRNAGQLSGGRV